MLKRKIERYLENWKCEKNRKPLIIKGCRQCGKTYSVLAYARNHYANVVYCNFFERKELITIFDGSLDVDHIIMMLSAYFGPSVKFEAGNTVLIFDEIQECPNARASLKFFAVDGRYDVICTASLLGISGYGIKDVSSIPVGYEKDIYMYPLDFEEFLWANGIDQSIIDLLERCFLAETPVPEAIHLRMRQLVLQYIVVGGMPDVVNNFIETHQVNEVLEIQRNIIRTYEDDMVKYADHHDTALIRESFRSIPKQLSKENKKFQYSLIQKNGSASKFTGSLQWIEDFGLISRCYNLSQPALPLSGNAVSSIFKIYMVDCGLLVSMLDDGTQFDILNGNLGIYKGAIIENFIADIFTKSGRKLYYFRKNSGLEIDFVIRFHDEATLVKVKPTTGNTKSVRTILNDPKKYNVHSAIQLGDYNVGRNDAILTIPLYMAFLICGY